MESIGKQHIFTAWDFLWASWVMQFIFILGTTGIGFNKSIQNKIIDLSDFGGSLYQFLNMNFYHRSSIYVIRIGAGIALLISILGSVSMIFEPFSLNLSIARALILGILNMLLQLSLIWGLSMTVIGLRSGTIKRGWAVGITEMLLSTGSKHLKSWIIIPIILNSTFIVKCYLSL
jgi:hypothetical protein